MIERDKLDETGNYYRSPRNQGALLNINNEALLAYKRTKARMNRVEELEDKVAYLTALVEKLIDSK